MKNFSQELTSIVRNSSIGKMSPRDIKVAEHVYQNSVAINAAQIINQVKAARDEHDIHTPHYNVINNLLIDLQTKYTTFYALCLTDRIKVDGDK